MLYLNETGSCVIIFLNEFISCEFILFLKFFSLTQYALLMILIKIYKYHMKIEIIDNLFVLIILFESSISENSLFEKD